MSAAPLLRGHAPGATVGWREGQPVAWERMIAAAAALSVRLPRGGYCINLCEDRLNFILGYCAALLGSATSLLPQSRADGVIRELCETYGGAVVITDQPGIAGDGARRIDAGTWPACGATAAVPEIPCDQRAAILFTSGSTGAPRPHAKSWGSLTRAAAAVAARIPLAPGSGILGVVPAQHMWGFEMTVMLPLQTGCAVAGGCPLLPADIAVALQTLPGPRWLVATPLHLRACVAADEPLGGLDGVLCATSALPTELAHRFEARYRAPLHEIYGSTETGTLAARRPARTPVFETLGSITLAAYPDAMVARGGHLTEPVKLNDVLELRDEHRFLLHGRAEDLVKIAGKRASLAALHAELSRVPGVRDGALWLQGAGSGEPRLAAFVVAPETTPGEILEHLRHRLDPVFLPRPLVRVEALPRNSTGKLTQESLHQLAAAHGCSAPLPQAGEDSWQEVAATHPALPFHFPGDPVVPGAWLLALVERAARERYGATLTVCGVPDTRFRRLLRPAQRFRITLERVASDRLAFSVDSDETRIADGTLTVSGAA